MTTTYCDLVIGDSLIQTNPDEGKMIALRSLDAENRDQLIPHHINGMCGNRCRSVQFHTIVLVEDIRVDVEDTVWFEAQTQCIHDQYYTGWLPLAGLPHWKNHGQSMFKRISRNGTDIGHVLAYAPIIGTDTYRLPNCAYKTGIININHPYAILKMLTVDGQVYLDLAAIDHEAHDHVSLGWVKWDGSNLTIQSTIGPEYQPTTMKTIAEDVLTITQATIPSPPSVNRIHNPYGTDDTNIWITV